MTSLLGRIFGRSDRRQISRGDAAYAQAMTVSGDLLARMQKYSHSKDAAHAVMADVWAQNRNIPFMTTVFEAVAEAKAPIEQKPEDT